MLYLASSLNTSEFTDPLNDHALWRASAQDIESVDPSTWKIWLTTEVLHGDDSQTRLFSLNGQLHPISTVVKASVVYLRHQPTNHGSRLTILSTDQNAHDTLTGLLYAAYQTESARLDDFLHNNLELRVQAASLYDNETGDEDYHVYGDAIPLYKLYPSKSHELVHFSASTEIEAPLPVSLLYLNLQNHQGSFSVSTSHQPELSQLFAFANLLFRGQAIATTQSIHSF